MRVPSMRIPFSGLCPGDIIVEFTEDGPLRGLGLHKVDRTEETGWRGNSLFHVHVDGAREPWLTKGHRMVNVLALAPHEDEWAAFGAFLSVMTDNDGSE